MEVFRPIDFFHLGLFNFQFLGLIFFGICFSIDYHSQWFLFLDCKFFSSFIGPLQSSSRVLISDMIPPKKGGQFFGFAIFSGKITSFMGPLIYGFLIFISNDHRIGMSFVILLFIISFFILGKKNPLIRK